MQSWFMFTLEKPGLKPKRMVATIKGKDKIKAFKKAESLIHRLHPKSKIISLHEFDNTKYFKLKEEANDFNRRNGYAKS
jgi:hypothetical protein